MQKMKKVQNYAEALKLAYFQSFTPRVAMILGTGLGNIASSLEDKVEVPYANLPDFPDATVESHAGRFSMGNISGVPVIIQEGRFHLYEGKTPDEVCTGVRTMAMMGAEALIITNAAGSINPLFEAESLMLIDDHINMSGQSPLTGPNIDEWGLRFPDMSEVYDHELMKVIEERAALQGIKLQKGVYLCTPGPQLETRAETRAYRLMGADAVGMSTVMEVIAARHMGMRVLGISCLTNKNLPDCMGKTSIEEIISAAEKTGKQLETLFASALPDLADCLKSN